MEKKFFSCNIFCVFLAFHQLRKLSLDEGKHTRNRIFFIFLLIRKPFSRKRWPACRYGQCANKGWISTGRAYFTWHGWLDPCFKLYLIYQSTINAHKINMVILQLFILFMYKLRKCDTLHFDYTLRLP